jgi:Tol biopolymer transport system component
MQKHHIPGTIRLYGTPAEETLIGKVYMLLGAGGTIVVQADHPRRIWAISATGKGARPLEVLDEKDAMLVPLQVLSERELLVASWDEENPTLDLVSLETGEQHPLLRAFVDPSGYRLLPSGHFVWASGGALLAVRLDLEGGALAGPPVTVAEGLRTYLGVGHNVAVSDTGTLVYAPSAGPQESRLVWVDREGRTTPICGAGGASRFFRSGLSPDGREAAVTLVVGFDRDIWIFDLERGTRRRLTAEGQNFNPLWDPTGTWIAFGSRRGGLKGVFRKRSDGTGEDELLFENPAGPFPVAWSPDGRTLAIVPWGRPEIWLHSIEGGTSTVVKDAVGWPAGLVFSPDWRWLAFQSDETGRNEIFVQPFPGPGPRTVVSTSGGTRPAWAPSGGELFYHDENRVMAVPLETRPQLRVGTPRVLFEGPYWAGLNVSPDGERFLMFREEDQGPITELRVVVNWGEELERLVP